MDNNLVFTFDRDYEGTLRFLQDYMSSDSSLPVQSKWAMSAELVLEPLGWNALWKVSKNQCKEYNIRYPCYVYINVEEINYEDLCATVSILAVQEGSVVLPEEVNNVPLIHLYPTIIQPNTVVDMKDTANFIDILRLFYSYIWMPWDKPDKKLPWDVIESRLCFWWDIRNNKVPGCIVRTSAMLKAQAADISDRIKKMEVDMSFCDDNDLPVPPGRAFKLAKLYSRIKEIKNKFQYFEVPFIRSEYYEEISSTRSQKMAFVGHGKIDSMLAVQREISRTMGGETVVSTASSIEDALSSSVNVILLASGIHNMPHSPLENVSIKGFGDANIICSDADICLINFMMSGQLTDLKLSPSNVQTLVSAAGGDILLENCQLVDEDVFKDDPTPELYAQGCVVFADVHVVIRDCHFKNLYTGIVIHKGGKVDLINCKIEKCGVGIQMYAGAELNISGSELSKCYEHCIRYEVSANGDYCSNNKTIEGVNISESMIGTESENDIAYIRHNVAGLSDKIHTSLDDSGTFAFN